MSRLVITPQTSGTSRYYDWLPMPTVTASDVIFVGLVAIFNHESNFLAFTATGNFTVDWGDGSSSENVNSGVTAQHQYTYSSISASTLSSRGYKQCIVIVTPQSGQSLNTIDINKRHSSASAFAQSSPWLEIICSCTAASTGGFSSGGSSTVSRMLELATIYNGASRTSFASMFASCTALTTINSFTTSAGTNFTSMFGSCTSLQSIPTFDTAVGTNFTSMFSACSSLQAIPALNLGAMTTSTSMFANCLSLARSEVTGVAISHSYGNCNLSATALNEIYTNLTTVIATITVTNNYGTAGDDPTIATAKNWIVV